MDYSFNTAWNTVMETLKTGIHDLGSLHPAIVHLPIALLMLAPLFIILGMIFHKVARPMFITALIVLSFGTGSIFMAIESGEEASEHVPSAPQILDTLEMHDHLAHMMRNYFSILTVIMAVFALSYPKLERQLNRKGINVLMLVLLCFYAYCLIYLLNTAHQGGKLVHQFGVRSDLYSPHSPE